MFLPLSDGAHGEFPLVKPFLPDVPRESVTSGKKRLETTGMRGSTEEGLTVFTPRYARKTSCERRKQGGRELWDFSSVCTACFERLGG